MGDSLLSYQLAPYAMREEDSQGRAYTEPRHPYRGEYERDRARIIHCAAFRRLASKTQVLAGRVNDHHRTRLTHTLEVVQIARTIGQQLRLNTDLIEVIALSHDLGHPPFGHAGERALDSCLAEEGGFEHNLHSLRLVQELERAYPQFPGLNLTWEVREAMVRHSPRRDHPSVAIFLQSGGPLLEMQVVDAADGIAYDAHDADDALGAGLLELDDLRRVEFWRRGTELVRHRYGPLSDHQERAAVVRTLVDWQTSDLIEQSWKNIKTAGVSSPHDARTAGSLIEFSPLMRSLRAGLEEFLRRNVYFHPLVMARTQRGWRMLQALFERLSNELRLIPSRYWHWRTTDTPARIAGDYIAGMTDRFARRTYRRLAQRTGGQEFV